MVVCCDEHEEACQTQVREWYGKYRGDMAGVQHARRTSKKYEIHD
jgi:hypothetical protein